MRTTLLTTVLLLVAAPLAGQDFRWSGRLGAGRTLEIKGVNGDIEAVAADGAEAIIVAEKRGRRSDPESVDIEVVEHEGGVTICAVYPTPPRARRENECAPGSAGQMSTQNNDVSVEFRVRVPAGVRFVARTVNGEVAATSLRGDVVAKTVNGGVTVTTTGRAEATTVNGGIDVRMGTRLTDDLSFETVNGSIEVEMPEGLGAELEARTTNGDIQSDFPLTVRGRISPRRIAATIGSGGPRLELQTVNGSIRLRRR